MRAVEEQLQAAEHVVHLALGEEDDAPVEHDVGVGPVQQEEVGVPGDGDAHVGARVAVPLQQHGDKRGDR